MSTAATLETSSASVHPQETNGVQQITAASGLYIAAAADRFFESAGPTLNDAFRHTSWSPTRQRILDALEATSQSPSRIAAFCQCGGNQWLAVGADDTSKYRIHMNNCHDRFCVPCANAAASAASRVVLHHMNGRSCRFLTLTTKSTDLPLTQQLDHLRDSFKKLRKTARWGVHVVGGIAFFELTWNKTTQRWHPHLHTLIEGTYFPQNLIRDLWQQVTGDSSIVDIRPITDARRTAEYVAKYCTKGWNQSILHDDAALLEAIAALHGRRLALCFGSWRGFALNHKENEQQWSPVCPMHVIDRRAAEGDEWAKALLRHLNNPRDNTSPGPMPYGWLEGVIPGPAPPPPSVQTDLQAYFVDETGTTFESDTRPF